MVFLSNLWDSMSRIKKRIGKAWCIMPRIKGRFAPLTEELGSDERFILGCTDLEKLLYILIVYTCHMTRHQAPVNPKFYRHRFGVRAHSHQIHTAIDSLLKRFPKLRCSDGKLSLLNSATYESEILPKVPLEVEVEVDKKKSKRESATDTQFIETLKANPAFKCLDVDRELGKCQAWCLANGKSPNRRRFVNWLNRAEKPLQVSPKAVPSNGKDREQLEKWKKEAAPMPEECREQLTRFGIGGRT
jgi:hypothetical protein